VDEELMLGRVTMTGFHSFVVARCLGIKEHPAGWKGNEAADLMACLAEAELLLAPGAPPSLPFEALTTYLEEELTEFNLRFHLARNRQLKGHTKAEQGDWDGAGYHFIQLADPQLGMLHLGQSWAEELNMLKLAVQHANRLKPKFLLVSGDLTDTWPDDPRKRELIDAQVAAFREALRELDDDIPLVLQPGNHDVGQNPTMALVDDYKERFGDDYFAFWAGGVKYVALNSQYYHTLCSMEDDNEEAAKMEAEQRAWLERELSPEATAGATHVVLLSHMAPFMGTEGEPCGHFNWRVEPRQWMLKLIAKCRPVPTLWLAGHYHQNVTVSTSSGVEVVTTGACGGTIHWKKEPAIIATNSEFNFRECVNQPAVTADAFHSGMRICRVTKDRILHRWFELCHVPTTFDECFTITDGELESKRSSLVSTLLERLEISMDLPNVDKAEKASSMRHSYRDEDLDFMVMPHRAKTYA